MRNNNDINNDNNSNKDSNDNECDDNNNDTDNNNDNNNDNDDNNNDNDDNNNDNDRNNNDNDDNNNDTTNNNNDTDDNNNDNDSNKNKNSSSISTTLTRSNLQHFVKMFVTENENVAKCSDDDWKQFIAAQFWSPKITIYFCHQMYEMKKLNSKWSVEIFLYFMY